MEQVPFLDLKRIFADHREEFTRTLLTVAENAAFIGGEPVREFEQGFASWIGGGAVSVGCANGTDAITLAARSLKLPAGSEALVPAMTYIATAAALVNAGLEVRLVDVEPGTWLISPEKLEAAIGPQTRLIVAVHLYGQMAEMDRIRAIADQHDCLVLEDAAQAHGAKWKGHPVGHWSDIATYSFYPGKNLGAFGDAGAILSRDASRIDYCRALGNHGGLSKYQHDFVGMSSRLDGMQAAILSAKLKYIEGWNEARRRVARQYYEGLSGIPGLDLPIEKPQGTHVYHLFPVLVEKRDDFVSFLKQRQIETGVHYPKAIHQQPAFSGLAGRSFPMAERVACHGVSLPMGPTLTEKQVAWVVSSVRSYFGKPGFHPR